MAHGKGHGNGCVAFRGHYSLGLGCGEGQENGNSYLLGRSKETTMRIHASFFCRLWCLVPKTIMLEPWTLREVGLWGMTKGSQCDGLG